ncbi:MAG: hypothetical protein IJR92_00970 [Alphaproteobacteria bacterium]|nr:hypothetical protein [Alphaproteobacteria bacterium]
MRKINLFFIVIFGAVFCSGAMAAVSNFTPKKAAAVKIDKEATTKTSLGASLLPNVISLATSVMDFNKSQQELTAECEPSSSDITFVNNMIKEWAIAGAQNPFDYGILKCTGVNSYESSVRNNVTALDDALLICYDSFSDSDARGAVWAGFPKAAVAEYCSSGETLSNCEARNKKKITNLWTLYDKIDFSDKDYIKSEANSLAALKEKADKCSPKKIAAKRMEAMGGFVNSAIGSVGQQADTENMMENVKSLMGQKGLGGNLGGLSQIAGQMLNR